MRTAQEQQLINKIAHVEELTPEEIEAITPDMLNSTINDGSDKAEWSVAFALASCYPAGRTILAANHCVLGLHINAETLNAIIQQGPYAGWSVAYALTETTRGRAILAANNNTLGLKINAEALNAIVHRGLYGERSLAVELAGFAEGCAILAANNHALALQISEKTLYAPISYSGVVDVLGRTPEGRTMLAVIRERHKNNNVMLALYSTKAVDRLGKNSSIKALNRELLDSVLTMLDGRTPQRLSLK